MQNNAAFPIMSPDIAREQRRAYAAAQRDRDDAILQALGHPAGRTFLAAELDAETARLRHRPGDAHADLANQLGRVELLRDLLQRLARASQPNRNTGD